MSRKVSREVTQTHSCSYNVLQIVLSCLEDKLASSSLSRLWIGFPTEPRAIDPQESNSTAAITAPLIRSMIVKRGYNHTSVYTIGEVHDGH